MMIRTGGISAVAVVIAAAAVALASRTEAIVPLFLWSARPYFANDHTSVSESVTLPAFRQIFEQIISPQQEIASDMKYLNTPTYYSSVHTKPEIVVAFVYSALSSAAASREAGAYDAHPSADHVPNANFRYLRSALSSAASSLSAPSYVATSAISDDVVTMHAALAPNAEVFATQIESGDSENACDSLLTHFNDHSYAFHNKQTDLIVVKFTDIDRNDRCMERVASYVHTHSGGDYLAILSADAASHAQLSFAETSSVLNGVNFAARFRTQATATATNSTSKYPGVKMITSDVFWALFLGLIMIVAISCGVCWVQSIETPARFTSTPLALSKEY